MNEVLDLVKNSKQLWERIRGNRERSSQVLKDGEGKRKNLIAIVIVNRLGEEVVEDWEARADPNRNEWGLSGSTNPFLAGMDWLDLYICQSPSSGISDLQGRGSQVPWSKL